MGIKNIFSFVAGMAICFSAQAQRTDSVWTLATCIAYATQQNISVQQQGLSNETYRIKSEQARASRFPSLGASVSQHVNWGKTLAAGSYTSYSESDGTSYGLNSSVELFNGFRTSSGIKKADLSYKAGALEAEALKESVSLNVLDAYLQVLYAEEQVKNSKKQIIATTQQLLLSDERLKLGLASKSDYLQVKSQLATEKLTLANAQSQLALNRVALMQLMELPLTEPFDIYHPALDLAGDPEPAIDPDSAYRLALQIKPQIESAALNKQIATLDANIAKAGFLPTLSLTGGLSSGYNSEMAMAYGFQVKNKMVPSVGLSLSIPIYQNRQVRSNVAIARIGLANAALAEQNTRNVLRKAIEQACVNVAAANAKYVASLEKFNAMNESFNVAQEKYNQGIFNSVDYLVQKTNLIAAESDLLLSKYNLVFSKKVLNFFSGTPLTL